MDAKAMLCVITLATALPVAAFGCGRSLTAVEPASLFDLAGASAESEIISLADDPSKPTSPVKLIFIHHSTGGNWLADVAAHEYAGGLGRELMNNNYFVSATNYGWEVGGDAIGDRTDIGNWWEWFRGPYSATYMSGLYAESGQNIGDYGSWPRLSDPGGENEVIMFKSCFPNSHLGGNPNDEPTIGDNPLRGQDAWSGDSVHNVANAKGVYNDILECFATRQDKLFVVITAPPLLENDLYQPTDAAHAANARAFNDWLVNDWLTAYPHNNVAVFDLYNVLTSNGGDHNTPDTDAMTGDHHRWNAGAVEHIHTESNDFASYASAGDSHPTGAGGQKAGAEFVPLLNVYYNRWKSGTSPTQPNLALTAPTESTSWPVNSQQQIRWTTTPAGSVTQVNLYYSMDSVTTTLASAIANNGSYASTTPLIPTTSARVRVESVVSPTTVFAVSEAFALYASSANDAFVYLPLVAKNHTGSPSTDGDLIRPADLVYLGAFRLPDSPGTPDNVGWEWNGWASGMTYYPDGDPGGPTDGYPGSIFGVGHDHTQYISEINIPVPRVSSQKDVNDLNTAETLQDFHNIRDEVFDPSTYWELPRVGLAYLPKQGAQATGKLYFSWAGHDVGAEADAGPTHGWCELDLSNPQAAGPWRVGGYVKYVTSDYMFDIPQSWADAYTPGMYLATGRLRQGGQGAMGPSVFAYGPWNDGNPPADDSTLSVVPLLLYGNVFDGNPTTSNYQHCDEWTGGAWLTAGEKSAVIFVGTKSSENCWYGCADGTDEPPWPDDCDKGYWADSYVGQILFCSPDDVAAVAQGTMETWQPQPYATLNIDAYLYSIEEAQQVHHVGAAALDRERGLLYVFEPLADGDKPLVHVWQIQ